MLATVTDWLWSYVLIVALLAVGIRLTVAARFVQVRLFREMFRGLSGGFSGTEKGLSSFQALVVSVAGRVGGWLGDLPRRSCLLHAAGTGLDNHACYLLRASLGNHWLRV